MANSGKKSWSGTSIDELYENNDPYCFSNTPVVPSRNHAVLYELPVTLTTPPKPHRSSQTLHWDINYVKLPYSSQNVFPVKNENGEEILKNRWELIENTLLRPINSSRELEAAIKCYNTRLPPFLALHHFFEEVLDEDEGEAFFKSILPGIIQLALQLPEILPGNLPLLQKETCLSVSLSQLQIASLLANGFLCTFPWRKEVSNTYPGANFARLFAAFHRSKRLNCVVEKIKAICHYFRRVLTKAPVGTATFKRKFLQRNQFPRWDQLDNNLGNTKIHICSKGTIENNGHGLLQVDFANKFVGGGVLGYGCVQEEIRFIICPELIISRLFTEELNSSEALIITGAERYSNYSGYGDTFVWEGDHIDQTPYDCYGRRKTAIVAIDATKFNKIIDQFSTSHILRELNKAYVGFHSNSTGKLAPVATGNWGCGAFKGDSKLKSIIQLMACSAAKRNMVYYTFDDTELEESIYNLYIFMADNKVRINELWRILCHFVTSKKNPTKLIPYIQQAYFDLHAKPNMRDYFETNSENVEPSTSSKSAFKSSGTWPTSSHAKNRNSPTTSTSTGDFRKQKAASSRVTSSTSSIDNERKSRSSTENEEQLSQTDDIINLFKIIDGCDRESKEDVLETSMLSCIDKFGESKTDKNTREVSDSVSIDMEVFESMKDKKTTSSKRKISDYFAKVTK